MGGNNVAGHYLDKASMLNLFIVKNTRIPNFAIGLDDFAGTGFTREYIVATSAFNNAKLSLGLGWGKYAGVNSFNNPFLHYPNLYL